MRYAVKVRQPNVSATNFAIMTFDTTSPFGAELCAAAVYCLQALGVMSSTEIVDITKSDPSNPGPGLPVIPDRAKVNEIVADFGVEGTDLPNPPAIPGSETVLGVVRGPAGSQGPLGTSIMITETAVAGPKGRMYIPFVALQTLNPDTGRVLEEWRSKAERILRVFYGITSLSGVPVANFTPSFQVFSKKSGTASLIIAANASPNFASLSSRRR